jgi:hypothetical protein
VDGLLRLYIRQEEARGEIKTPASNQRVLSGICRPEIHMYSLLKKFGLTAAIGFALLVGICPAQAGLAELEKNDRGRAGGE